LLRERQHHHFEHELQREEGVVFAAAYELQQRRAFLEHGRHIL
jgi:hypothetical protein